MRSTSLRFPDTANFNNYIENQKAFERHKKQLDKIYGRLNYKSSVEFGITDNNSFKLLEEKTKQINYLHRFYKEEKNRLITKDNLIMGQKLHQIEKRKNQITLNDEFMKEKLSLIKNRSEMLKSILNEQMKVENENIGIRLEQKSQPTISNKVINENYNSNMNYKKFSNKFELPNIIDKVPKILKRKMDVSPYDRMKRSMPFERYASLNSTPRSLNYNKNSSNNSSKDFGKIGISKENLLAKSIEFGRSIRNDEYY